MELEQKWPVLGGHVRAAEWLGIWADLGRAPGTIDAYARGLAEYLRVCERDGIDPVELRRGIGYVIQQIGLFPNMTVRQNIAFPLVVRKAPAAETKRRVEELLELVHLRDEGDRYPNQISGGQQQRGALARALAPSPQVLLLDEPLSALDATVRLQLRDEIRRIQTRLGITTLFVTHDQEEALSVSDRVVVLSQGRIAQVGAPAEIYGDPRTVFVAQFIGTMNRIAGTVPVTGQGVVEARGQLLRADRAHAWRSGAPALLLIRPESIAVEPLTGSAPAPEVGLVGTVRVRTFQGPVTRLTVESAVGELKVDIASAEALSLSDGDRVALTWDPAAPRVIDPSDGNRTFTQDNELSAVSYQPTAVG